MRSGAIERVTVAPADERVSVAACTEVPGCEPDDVVDRRGGRGRFRRCVGGGFDARLGRWLGGRIRRRGRFGGRVRCGSRLRGRVRAGVGSAVGAGVGSGDADGSVDGVALGSADGSGSAAATGATASSDATMSMTCNATSRR